MHKLSKIKIGILSILSIFLLVVFIIGCENPKRRSLTRNVRPSKPAAQSTTPSSTRSKSRFSSSCSLPRKSSGKKCEGNDECEELCGDRDYLNLGGRGERDCLQLSIDTVNDIYEVYDILEGNANQDDLENIKEDQINLYCGAVKELDSDKLFTDIITNKSSSSKVGRVLHWLSVEESVLSFFQDADPKSDDFDIFESLLRRFGDDVIDGLTKEIDDRNSSDDYPLFLLARENNHDDLEEYILLYIDEEYCTSSSNKPSLYNEVEGKIVAYDSTPSYPTDQYPVLTDDARRQKIERQQGKHVCFVGVYCKIVSRAHPDEQSDLLDDLEDEYNNYYDYDFIRDKKNDGGLELDGDYTFENLCKQLKIRWDITGKKYDY